jgi:hypothetical protein
MSYIQWNPSIPGLMEDITCFKCSTVLSRLIRTDRLVDRQVQNGVVKEYYLATRSATSEYATLSIPMEDGSTTEMPICKGCHGSVQTQADFEEALAAGIAASDDEDTRHGKAPRLDSTFRSKKPHKK